MEIDYQKLGLVIIFTGILALSISEIPFSYEEIFIDVKTDKPSYQTGDTILISGTVGEITNDYAISLSVESPDGHIVTVHQTFPLSDKTFQAEIIAGGKIWQNGSYTIFTRYGPENIATTFEFVKTSKNNIIITTDKTSYQPNDEVHFTVESLQLNSNSDILDIIGNQKDKQVTISSNLGILDDYLLVETGTDTGIFAGKITLTGSNSKTGGDGPNNGKLAVSEYDKITITFSDEHDVFSTSAVVEKPQIEINVKPEKPVYDHTETVTVTGTISPYIQGQKVSVTWLLPNGTVFGNSWSSNINPDGSFEAGVWNGIFSEIQGDYKAIVEYDNTLGSTDFEIRKTSNESPISDIKQQGQNLLTGFHKTNELTDKIVGSGLYQNGFETGTAALFLLIGPSEITYDENYDVTYYSNDYTIKNGRVFLKSENGASSTLVFVKDSWSFEYDSDKTSFSAKGKVQNRQTEQIFTIQLEGNNEKLDRQPSKIYLIQGKNEGKIPFVDEFRTYLIGYLKQG